MDCRYMYYLIGTLAFTLISVVLSGSILRTKSQIKEFPLKRLFEVGLSSNEANMFIKHQRVKGKPLELQYEQTRETDMTTIESELLADVSQKIIARQRFISQVRNKPKPATL